MTGMTEMTIKIESESACPHLSVPANLSKRLA
ncbi:MAG: hypothetical protein K0S65_3353 [Labilithrix sp.]|nr:hypothetical protein [Labilithrix sp.]